jgi:hypothetical protein
MKKLAPFLVVAAFILIWAPLYPVLAEDGHIASRSGEPLRPTLFHTTLAKDASGSAGKNTFFLHLNRSSDFADKIEQFRIKIASREAQLKAKLDKFKDQHRSELALKVSSNLNKINKNRTDSMGKHLDTLSDILGKVQDRASGSASESGVQAAIASASASITSARDAVNAQAQKDYTINATSEASLQSEVKTERNMLLKDLTSVKQLVMTAKQSVVAAIRATAHVQGELNGQKESNQ